MAKKYRRRRTSSRPRGRQVSSRKVDQWFYELEEALRDESFEEAKQLTRKILRNIPRDSEAGLDALNHLATTLGMLHEYAAAYKVLSEAIELDPERSEFWYNRALSAIYTARTGQALRDLERAIALEQDKRVLRVYQEKLDFFRRAVNQDIALRGPDFTLEQLIEQQAVFNQGMALLEEERYEEAEPLFKQVIEMGDVLPQPWANLAGCYMAQERYDEAEAALKRALEIDPTYDVALQNLLKMPYIREHGIDALEKRIRSPFKETPLPHTITMIEE